MLNLIEHAHIQIWKSVCAYLRLHTAVNHSLFAMLYVQPAD